jgi:hypothetical protein
VLPCLRSLPLCCLRGCGAGGWGRRCLRRRRRCPLPGAGRGGPRCRAARGRRLAGAKGGLLLLVVQWHVGALGPTVGGGGTTTAPPQHCGGAGGCGGTNSAAPWGARRGVHARGRLQRLEGRSRRKGWASPTEGGKQWPGRRAGAAAGGRVRAAARVRAGGAGQAICRRGRRLPRGPPAPRQTGRAPRQTGPLAERRGACRGDDVTSPLGAITSPCARSSQIGPRPRPRRGRPAHRRPRRPPEWPPCT